ncbi:MAG: hypothetical protein SCH66_13450 [Methanolobus sp.]|nr:hypothetical protein [Methanolobus sp.]
MFNECFFCGQSFGYEALDERYLHRVGRYLVCYNCITELGDALRLSIIIEKEDTEVESYTKNIFAV